MATQEKSASLCPTALVAARGVSLGWARLPALGRRTALRGAIEVLLERQISQVNGILAQR